MIPITLLITVTWFDWYNHMACFPENYCVHTEVSSLNEINACAESWYGTCIADYEKRINNDGVSAELELVLMGHVEVWEGYDYRVLSERTTE